MDELEELVRQFLEIYDLEDPPFSGCDRCAETEEAVKEIKEYIDSIDWKL